jgi:hypothetical protein
MTPVSLNPPLPINLFSTFYFLLSAFFMNPRDWKLES